jgi:hypothetical protein
MDDGAKIEKVISLEQAVVDQDFVAHRVYRMSVW